MPDFLTRQNKLSYGEYLFGFQLQDISSWNSFVRLLYRPCDPASLAVTRILYGFLMVIDIATERGLMHLGDKWGSSTICHFPLFDFLQPLTLKWMFVVYSIMLFGAIGLLLGFGYRLCSCAFLITYWYIFLLDTTAWNNHSYLFGLLGSLLAISGAGQYWSLDSRYRNKSDVSNSIPLWNYVLIRSQIFLVYFIAGLKKLDADWIGGYSMRYLSSHWVFFPFSLLLTNDQIDYYVVHWFGFFFDFTIGFFMLHSRSRPVAFLFCAAFNLMNSQLFNIGVFPFMMLATMPIFCNTDWPKRVLDILLHRRRSEGHCHTLEKLTKMDKASNAQNINHSSDQLLKKRNSRKISRRQHCISVIVLGYILIQMCLPYSHFITKGCNHWTDGLYGYSWNMMVHSWQQLHARITVKDKENDRVFYLDPSKWTLRDRWSRYGKLAKQFGHCVQQRFASLEIHNIELYLDIWVSLNERFHQRMFDPRVDILRAEWSAFQTTQWMKPLLNDLAEYRNEIRKKAEYYQSIWPDIITVFVADFPGLTTDHFVSEDFSNTSIEVLGGEIMVDMPNNGSVILRVGDYRHLPGAKQYHIRVISSTPAFYAYLSANKTTDEFRQLIQSYKCMKYSLNGTCQRQAFSG